MTTLTRIASSKPRRLGLPGVAILATLLTAGWLIERHSVEPQRATTPFRVGFEYSPPHQFISEDGRPEGPAIEVITEAARRRHIPIQWVYEPKGPEPALTSGKADLWPIVADLPERHKFMYISDPWLASSIYMVALQSTGIRTPQDAVGHTVSHGGSNLNHRLAVTDFAQSKAIPGNSAIDALDMMCQGRVDLAISSANNIQFGLASLPSCKDRKLWFYPLPHGRLNSGIGASLQRAGAKEAADALRDEINTLANEGLLSSAYFGWSSDLNNESLAITYLNEVRRRNNYMSGGLIALGLAFGMLGLLTYRLRVARRAAEAASVSKTRFLANMSHEIRTPMNGVIGMTELAMETESREEQREYLEMVKLSGNALLGIINDILDVSKMEAGKLRLDPIPFAVRSTLLHALRTVAMRAHQKGLELTCEIAPDVPDVLIGDPDRLRQIVVNLAGNALKFTERGEVGLEARLISQDDVAETAQIQFTVRDTGVGIPRERQAAVFDAFSQADGSTTRRFGGTGLGLTICKNLVALMGGRIWLDSRAGSGTEVHFTAVFPVAQHAAPVVGAEEAPCFAGRRALLVDDNATVRRALGGFLKRIGMLVTCAPSGAETLAVLAKSAQPFDLLLLDLQMPEQDGFETLARIRDQHPDFAAKVVALGSIGCGCDAVCRETLGIAATFTKPFLYAELLRTLQDLLSDGGAETAEAAPAGSSRTDDPAQGLTVLVAEDNSVNQTLVRRLLTRRGHDVTTVGDGRAALLEFERRRFDVILMDLQMPEMDGLSATMEIRSRERREHLPRTPIVALTANVMSGDREMCFNAGMDGYVAKPVRSSDLFAVIGDVCGAKVVAR
jgi:signal transduction histidine kinase/DNA-binding response OmpR family regulator